MEKFGNFWKILEIFEKIGKKWKFFKRNKKRKLVSFEGRKVKKKYPKKLTKKIKNDKFSVVFLSFGLKRRLKSYHFVKQQTRKKERFKVIPLLFLFT